MNNWIAAVSDPEFIRLGLWWMLGVLLLGLFAEVGERKLWGRPPNPAGLAVQRWEPLPHTPTSTDEHT